MSALRRRVRLWPWSELAYLRRELRAVKLSCSAEMKKGNRLTARILTLQRACEKHKGQERHDQAYIDALESRLEAVSIAAARSEITSATGNGFKATTIARAGSGETAA